MVEVQLPLVLFCWDSSRAWEERVGVLDDEFEVRTVESDEELSATLDQEVEVVVVPMRDVDADPAALVEGLVDPGETLPAAAIIPGEDTPSGLPENMETVRTPVSSADLRQLVRTLRKRARYEATVDRYYQLASELAERESPEGRPTGDTDTDLAELREKMEALEASLDETRATLDAEDIRALFREF
jgi:hypothetical protein